MTYFFLYKYIQIDTAFAENSVKIMKSVKNASLKKYYTFWHSLCHKLCTNSPWIFCEPPGQDAPKFTLSGNHPPVSGESSATLIHDFIVRFLEGTGQLCRWVIDWRTVLQLTNFCVKDICNSHGIKDSLCSIAPCTNFLHFLRGHHKKFLN